jgi:hypothetical protein
MHVQCVNPDPKARRARRMPEMFCAMRATRELVVRNLTVGRVRISIRPKAFLEKGHLVREMGRLQ